jgi:phage tail sheath protein FI
MATYNRPGVYLEEIASSAPVSSTPTATVATFIGALVKGPLTPTLVTSWNQFTSLYGDINANVANVDVATAAYLFFANGGSQCYVDRVVASNSAKSTVDIKGNTTVAIATHTPTKSGSTITFTSSAHSLKVGQTVVIAGVLASSVTANQSIYQGTFVVTAVPSATTFSVTNTAVSTAAAITTAGTVTAQTSQTELTLSSKNPGAWSNGLYYEISSSTSSVTYPGKYFNLTIYSGGTTSGYVVERFSDLTLLSSEPSYAPTIINASSNYVTAVDPNAANHTPANFSNTNTPLTTGLVAVSTVGGNGGISGTTITVASNPTISLGMAVIGKGIQSNTTVSEVSGGTITLSSAMAVADGTSLTFVNNALTGGTDGTAVTTANIAAAVSVLDAIAQPILLNAPGVTAAADVNLLLAYAYNRGDVFVIIDPTKATSDVTAQLTLANSYTGGSAGAAGRGYGAVYYPNLTIPNLTSSAPGATSVAYPGGAIAAKYATTDSSRGVFKSPAGLEARLSGVVAVPSLTNTELDYLNNGTTSPDTFASATPVNAIRYVPGAGIVVMGARTLSSTYNDRYISVRRSMIYLRKVLTDATAFALFESNDERLWNRLQTTCESILINFWQSGGLKGETVLDAFYVKADSSINTVTSTAAGEVHLEIGVALQRPAEFVVIRISQYDSGSVVTVL